MIYILVKIFLIFFCVIIILLNKIKTLKYNSKNILNNLQFYLNLTENIPIKYNIKIGIYCKSIKNGGIERLTSLLVNYLDKVNLFKIFLFTKVKENNEYFIAKKTKRIIIKFGLIKNLIKAAITNKIDIMIYQRYNYKEIQILNKISYFKTLFYNHSCFLFWIYAGKYKTFINLYDAYKNSKYIISLIPFENDYLFKKWGINSILMNNFITYDYNFIIPSHLSDKIIIMIGRANDKLKRYNLGIIAMKFIIKEIQNCEMKIISDFNEVKELEILVKYLYLEQYITFVGYSSIPEIYFKNASLHIFPTISESFGLALTETKIYGIPSILLGLDYVSSVKGGTIIIYDDKPETISKEAIKILKNKNYRNKLGKEARKSMQKFKNEMTLKKWIKLIFAIIKGEYCYKKMIYNENKISKIQALNIISKQLYLLKKRKKKFKNITLNNLENFTFMKNLNSLNI